MTTRQRIVADTSDLAMGWTRPLFSGAGEFVWLEFGDPDCARNLKRLIEAAYDALDLEVERDRVTAFVFHIAWMESEGVNTRELRNGRMSLFGFTNLQAIDAINSRSTTQRSLVRAAGLPSSNGALSVSVFDLKAKCAKMLVSSAYDLLAAEIALILAARIIATPTPTPTQVAGTPLVARGGAQPTGPLTLPQEAAYWWKDWHAPSSPSPQMEDAFVEQATTAERHLNTQGASQNPGQPGQQSGATDPIIVKIEEYLSKHFVLSAAAIPVLFSAVLPLLLKWFGGADTDETVPVYFASALRGFSLIYFALPAMIVYVILMDAISLITLATMSVPLLLLLFVDASTWTAGWWWFTVAVAGLATIAFAAWPVSRRVSIRNRSFTTSVAVPALMLIAFGLAYSTIMFNSPEHNLAIFARPMSITTAADNMIRTADSLAVYRRTAEVQAAASITGIKEELGSAIERERRVVANSYLHAHRLMLLTRQGLGSASADEWTAADSLRMEALKVAFARTRAAEGQVSYLKRPDTPTAKDSTKYVKDSTASAQKSALMRENGLLALKTDARELLGVARRQTQRTWAGELTFVQERGRLALVLLIVALGGAVAQAANAQRKRAMVLLCAVGALALPTLRPIYADGLDPQHPLSTFSLPTSSLAGIAADHDPKKEPTKAPGTPPGSVTGVVEDTTVTNLLKALRDTAKGISERLVVAKQALDSVVGRVSKE